jgi:hypothetical protein
VALVKAVVEGREVKLPDFLIVGTARSGTTSLHDYLNQHPEIFMPALKEPNFFVYGENPPSNSPRWKLNLITKFDYFRLFDPADEGQVVGEASSNYLYRYESSIRNMKACLPDWKNLKIVIMLREPVERAFSMYLLYRLEGIETLPFEEALKKAPERLRENWGGAYDYAGFGLYYGQVKAYLDEFPHVKIYLFDDLKADTAGLVRDLFGFLGVDDSFSPDVGRRLNPSGEPLSRRAFSLLKRPDLVSSLFPPLRLIPLETRVRMTKKLESLILRRGKREMREETRRYLKDLYREDVLRLQDLIDRDLTVWL